MALTVMEKNPTLLGFVKEKASWASEETEEVLGLFPLSFVSVKVTQHILLTT